MSAGDGLASLEAQLGHRFADPGRLETALTHASFAAEADAGESNERLEFLGDAVIGLVVAELLFEAHPDWDEGDLTRARAALVNKRALAGCARDLELGQWVRLGRTEQRSDGAGKDTILANAFEAVVGALYLDAGLAPVKRLTQRLFGDALARGAAIDPKTEFQEWAHARFQATPSYRTASDSGVEADAARFAVEVYVGDERWGAGVGRSKQAAAEAAARNALARTRRGG